LCPHKGQKFGFPSIGSLQPPHTLTSDSPQWRQNLAFSFVTGVLHLGQGLGADLPQAGQAELSFFISASQDVHGL